LRYNRTNKQRGFVWRGNASDPNETDIDMNLETRLEEKRKKLNRGF
jgi:hypothetical protein